MHLGDPCSGHKGPVFYKEPGLPRCGQMGGADPGGVGDNVGRGDGGGERACGWALRARTHPHQPKTHSRDAHARRLKPPGAGAELGV